MSFSRYWDIGMDVELLRCWLTLFVHYACTIYLLSCGMFVGQVRTLHCPRKFPSNHFIILFWSALL